MRQEVINFIKSIQEKELSNDEMIEFATVLIPNISDGFIFYLYEMGIKHQLTKSKELLNHEVVSNYSLKLNIENKIDLIDSLNYFNHCLFDDGTPCNQLAEEMCQQGVKYLDEINEMDIWHQNLKNGYRKLCNFAKKDESVGLKNGK